MLLIKKIAVYINILNCSLIKYFAKELIKNDINLTPEQYLVMDILWDEGVMSQQTIADIIQKDKNSVTKFIDSLEKKGIVQRIQSKDDKRKNYIVLTPFVLEKKEMLEERVKKLDAIVRKDIEEDEFKTFVKVLNKMLDNLVKDS